VLEAVHIAIACTWWDTAGDFQSRQRGGNSKTDRWEEQQKRRVQQEAGSARRKAAAASTARSPVVMAKSRNTRLAWGLIHRGAALRVYPPRTRLAVALLAQALGACLLPLVDSGTLRTEDSASFACRPQLQCRNSRKPELVKRRLLFFLRSSSSLPCQ